MAAVTRRQYKGAAAQTTTTNALSVSDTSVTLTAVTGFPSTPAVPFIVVIDPGTSSEEKCSATISGSTLTLVRAQDDTTAATHTSGATIYPVFSADEADEANLFTSTMTTRGDLLTMGSGPTVARIAIGASGTVLKSDGTDASFGTVAAAGLATDSVTTVKIQDLAVTGIKRANATVSTKTASYTLVAADRNTKVVMDAGATNTTITVNTSLFAAGDTLEILNTSTSGTCTITAGTATVASAGSLALGLNQGGTLYFTSAGVSVFQANGVTAAAGGKLLQLVQTVKSDTYTQAINSTYTDITGLSVSITPTLATSKVYVMVVVQSANDNASNERAFFRIVRDSTAIGLGDTAGSRTRATMGSFAVINSQTIVSSVNNFLDSPATTSATTYKVQMFTTSVATQFVNRSQNNSDAAYEGRMISTITVMEIGA